MYKGVKGLRTQKRRGCSSRMTGKNRWYDIINYTVCVTYTAMSFVGLVEFLFATPEIKDKRLAFWSNICQDPLEQFLRCQRQRGGIPMSNNSAKHSSAKGS